jgi:hypothetical protein
MAPENLLACSFSPAATYEQLEEDTKQHHGQRYLWMLLDLLLASFWLSELVQVFDCLRAGNPKIKV